MGQVVNLHGPEHQNDNHQSQNLQNIYRCECKHDTREFHSNVFIQSSRRNSKGRNISGRCVIDTSVWNTYNELLISHSATTANLQYKTTRVRKGHATIGHPFCHQSRFYSLLIVWELWEIFQKAYTQLVVAAIGYPRPKASESSQRGLGNQSTKAQTLLPDHFPEWKYLK